MLGIVQEHEGIREGGGGSHPGPGPAWQAKKPTHCSACEGAQYQWLSGRYISNTVGDANVWPLVMPM